MLNFTLTVFPEVRYPLATPKQRQSCVIGDAPMPHLLDTRGRNSKRGDRRVKTPPR
jgi:hypothetical protein